MTLVKRKTRFNTSIIAVHHLFDELPSLFCLSHLHQNEAFVVPGSQRAVLCWFRGWSLEAGLAAEPGVVRELWLTADPGERQGIFGVALFGLECQLLGERKSIVSDVIHLYGWK